MLGSVAGMQFKTSAGCVAVLVLWWVAATAGPVVQWIARGYAAVVMRKTFATSVVAMEAVVSQLHHARTTRRLFPTPNRSVGLAMIAFTT